MRRNPKILYVFQQLGLAEQRGLGQQTFESLPEHFGLPRPVITFKAPYLEIIFPRLVQKPTGVKTGMVSTRLLKEEEAAGYEFIRAKQRMTKREYAERFKFSDRQAERHLAKFLELGLIQRKGASRSTYYEIST